ncbi:fibropellin-1-like [Mercenaria mercenaria]|uniref:fibropellin-1-like n=1 Tax=Mercenaria mercenaria TaxID=6596 RepID=UPI00234E4063|nr:fibropellin-1-like [Mercenaria mercenaria]
MLSAYSTALLFTTWNIGVFGSRCYSGYNWAGWGTCSHSCGGGFKVRHCYYDNTYENERCGTRCLNGGEFYGGKCHCVPGTVGRCCDDIKECDSNPCKNGGVCVEGINHYTCNCPAGTTGPNCDDILECASNPCKNGGTCHEHINYYTCDCVVGTTGPNCDDILECQSNPCLNGGTCIEHINGYSCQCLQGTTGYNCVDIPECISNPCQNGGTCVEMINMYKCNCPPAYIGVNCEKYLLALHDSVCRTGSRPSCYIVFRTKDTWQGAEEFCEARNGHLVIPEDTEEALYIENYLESMRVRYPEALFWLGGKKSGRSPPYWVHGEQVTAYRWPVGVSDNLPGTQCLTMDGRYNFEWQGFPCDRPTYFLCEEKVPFQLNHTGPVVG